MKYDSTTRTITLEARDCRYCQYGAGGPGEYTGAKTCPSCNGTGNGPRGGRGKCRNCYGRKTIPDFDNPIVCPACHGAYAGADQESYTDTLQPALWAEILPDLTVTVLFADRRGSWEEAHLGLSGMFSVTDYGDTWRLAANAITACEPGDHDAQEEAATMAVLDHVADYLAKDSTQACKVATRPDRDSNTLDLADGIVIIVHRDGWKPVPHRKGESLR